MLEPGTSVGRYRVLDVVARGGHGEVYRAFDTALKRDVALKVLRTDRGVDSTRLARQLIREARATAGTSHLNTVTIYDVGESAGQSFIAMEFVEGDSLRSIIQAGGTSVTAAARWLLELASALAAAHSAGFVHRDVKPSNVMVRPEGSIKLLDFGVAAEASLDNELPWSVSTQDGDGVPGTPIYMAPEALAGASPNPLSDQFAWGLVAYELLSGKHPRAASAESGTPWDTYYATPKPLHEVSPSIPVALSRVVERALALSPKDRFENMGAVVSAMSNLAETAAAEAETPSDRPTHTAPPMPAHSREKQPGTGRPPVKTLASWTLGVALVVAALTAVTVHRGTPAAAVRRTAPTVVDPPRGSPIALPLPVSSSRDAVAAYQEGLVAMHDGVNAAARSFLRAAALDPGMTAAYLQLVLVSLDAEGADDEANVLDAFRHAIAGRDQLSARDHALLGALEPALLHQPADWTTTERRIRTLVDGDKLDVGLQIVLGEVLVLEGKYQEADTVLEMAIGLDPSDVRARWLQADERILRGDLAGARETSTTCLAASPRATTCLAALHDVSSMEGNCAEVEALSQRRIATSPEDSAGYMELFEAELARGYPEDAIIATERQFLMHVNPDQHAWASAHFPWLRAVLRGDFATAGRLLDAEDAAAATDGDPEGQLHALMDRAELAIEIGDVASAGRAADAFLKRKPALLPSSYITRMALVRDPTPTALMLMERAKLLSPEAMRQRRDTWVAEWEARGAGRQTSFLWLEAYARPAETAEDARDALARLPEDLAPLLIGDALDTEALGRAYLLVGKFDLALPMLRKAAAQCSVRRFPFAIPRADYLAGVASESLGDRRSACTAYGKVIGRWGKASPPSRTAGLARQHVRALGCQL